MSECLLDVSVCNGKYRVILDTGGMRCLRYGEEWREIVGDNLIYWLAAELNDEREKLKKIQEIL